MNSEIENIIEGILNIAMSEGGNVYFHNTFLANENDMKKLDKINLQLSMYGEIHGMMLGGHWTYFKINPKGSLFSSVRIPSGLLSPFSRLSVSKSPVSRQMVSRSSGTYRFPEKYSFPSSVYLCFRFTISVSSV